MRTYVPLSLRTDTYRMGSRVVKMQHHGDLEAGPAWCCVVWMDLFGVDISRLAIRLDTNFCYVAAKKLDEKWLLYACMLVPEARCV